VRPGRPSHPPVPPEGPQLDVVQQWFQAVIIHPEGVPGGLGSEEAQRRLPIGPGELATVIAPSRNLTAEERLGIYAHAYYARLLEVLADRFPVLAQALGEEVFAGYAFEYLQRYPSRSYTLDRLGEDFPRFLAETRPDRDAVDLANVADLADPTAETPEAAAWPDFLIDLARLEWAIARVFDGPGAEGQPLLAPEALAALGPERFAAARLPPVPCLRLLAFRYPVNAYYTAVRQAALAGDTAEVPLPDPAPELVALSRTDFVVRRYSLTPTRYALLAAILDGARVEEALAAAAAASDTPDEALAAEVQEAFRFFAAQGFFLGME